MGVGPNRIEVEEIRHAEFAKADFQAAARQFVKKRKCVALVLDPVLAQGEYLVNHAAAQIGSFTQRRVTHDVQIGIAGQAKATGKCGAARFFDIDQQFGGVVQPHARVKRSEEHTSE